MTATNGNNGHNGNGRGNLHHAGNGNGANGNGANGNGANENGADGNGANGNDHSHGLKHNHGANGHNHSVPFLDLVTPHLQLGEELISTFKKALCTAAFIGGSMVENFEKSFADYCEAEYCVGVSSGTDALRFALTAAGVDPGDVVITVPNTFIATTEAISQAGAQIEFVDVDDHTYNMDPEKLRVFLEMQCRIEPANARLVTRKEKRRVAAVVPVHLYGQTADMDPILELAERYGLIVVEDACQAHGAEYFSQRENRWRKSGSMGRAAAFSFYPGKNLGACGEAGAVTTNDETVANRIRMLRDHGQSRKYHHEVEGYNGRLDAIQAGFLQVKLSYLATWNQQRRERAQTYHSLLLPLAEDVVVRNEAPWAKAVYHLYVVCVEDRDELIAKLAQDGIGTGIHYPVPLHLQNAYRHLGRKQGDFPVAERLSKQIVSLPMYPNLTLEQQTRVVAKLQEFVTRERESVLLAS